MEKRRTSGTKPKCFAYLVKKSGQSVERFFLRHRQCGRFIHNFFGWATESQRRVNTHEYRTFAYEQQNTLYIRFSADLSMVFRYKKNRNRTWEIKRAGASGTFWCHYIYGVPSRTPPQLRASLPILELTLSRINISMRRNKKGFYWTPYLCKIPLKIYDLSAPTLIECATWTEYRNVSGAREKYIIPLNYLGERVPVCFIYCTMMLRRFIAHLHIYFDVVVLPDLVSQLTILRRTTFFFNTRGIHQWKTK